MNPLTIDVERASSMWQGASMLLLDEDLSRSRQRQAEQVARSHRLVRRLSSARRWRSLSHWAARHANRMEDSA